MTTTAREQAAPAPISTRFPAYRVACDQRANARTTSRDSAMRNLVRIEKLNACQEPHRIEVLDRGQWLPEHVAIARRIMAARPTDPPQVVELPNGPLKVVAGGWTAETSARIEAAGIGSPEFCELLDTVPYDHEVILTADGRQTNLTGWCIAHANAPMDTWVRYERWTPEGHGSHGYVCRTCRLLVQAG